MNNKLYFKIDSPQGSDKSESGIIQRTLENAVVKVLSTFVPKGNPDFNHLIELIKTWAVEFDVEEGLVWREIGYDKNGNAIAAMSDDKNYGFWPDTQLTLDDYEGFNPIPMAFEKFESEWTKFERKKLACH
jgi:hypothetical protein